MRYLIVFLLPVLLVAGCGQKLETTKYFYSPTWLKDGRVIFVGLSETATKDMLGSQLGSTVTEYVTTIYPSGTGEGSSLFETTNNTPQDMTCSPTIEAHYAAYMDELRNGLFGKIVIRNVTTTLQTGLGRAELNFSPGIKSFDWTSGGRELVYCTTQEIRLVAVDGTNDRLVTPESNLEFVSWKYGGRIAFTTSGEGTTRVLSVIYPNGLNRTTLATGVSVQYPQISAANTNEVYGILSGAYVKVDVNTSTTTKIVASGFTGNLPRLSPAADKIVYDKAGEASGVYVLDVATGTETAIK
ncbi:hypothetical protein A3H38_06340 [candidate division WOR-1 bacterium RIFCSPLOWO2_02_FULL_46_20]|uniref:Lipoprotein n=1 Tax=candidate division WOR-1 bacterium RIFCSPLOWO2_02_FULL_46_20 TaxID=1802567 RepID=A0A1F4R3R9_UNCSA|nr:MAG: hypothetical protein A3H38_06340 [candidate division WOR-1 bacterium RIFCSPLOWO2_02_FULL_46_20]